jgi:hypothetical protein
MLASILGEIKERSSQICQSPIITRSKAEELNRAFATTEWTPRHWGFAFNGSNTFISAAKPHATKPVSSQGTDINRVISGSASRITFRSRESILPRQSPSSAIWLVMSCEGFRPTRDSAFFIFSPCRKEEPWILKAHLGSRRGA